MITCCAGQMTNQTLNHMRLPSMPPKKIFQPYELAKNSLKPPYWANITCRMMSQPVMNVNIAPQRNHQRAMFTFITGWLIILHVMFAQYGGFREFFASSYGWKIFFGGMLGSLMWFNVWFVIWPAQQVIIASATQVSKGGQAIPEAAARGQRAGFASRTNTLLSIPMLFFMGAASHLPMLVRTTRAGKVGAL